MKRNLIALALVLFFGNVLFASAQDTVPDAWLNGSTLRVSEYGTLLDVQNANGTSRFGTLNRDGFLVRYSLGGEMKTVQAIGATAGEGLRAGQVTVEGNSTIVTVKTADDALEITSRFTLHKVDKKESIIIRRSLKNISSGDLKVVATTQYLDPKVIGGRGAQFLPAQTSQRREANRLKQEAARRVTTFGCEGCLLLERPPHDPPCFTIVCWELGGLRPSALRLSAIRPSALPPLLTTTVNEISVEWKPRTESGTAGGVLGPSLMPSPVIDSDATTDNGVKHFVVAVKLKG